MSKQFCKKHARLRRATKCRATAKRLCMPRLSVYRTPKHMYAQVISPENGHVMASASSVGQKFKQLSMTTQDRKKVAALVGQLIAERTCAVGVNRVVFDRSGFKYHGRIQALAEAARAGGLEF